ncbi:uncharacterized protein MONOS_3567 [Monocercomonoides exilis]|uniref:uncharacterized protein n=1 Tax=Monocercomonoides exilis TaxID=2049356 RepID=UPI003559BAAB|nr:hypothetical protein MONOS_3567 [Monocercomonoides exilis]
MNLGIMKKDTYQFVCQTREKRCHISWMLLVFCAVAANLCEDQRVIDFKRVQDRQIESHEIFQSERYIGDNSKDIKENKVEDEVSELSKRVNNHGEDETDLTELRCFCFLSNGSATFERISLLGSWNIANVFEIERNGELVLEGCKVRSSCDCSSLAKTSTANVSIFNISMSGSQSPAHVTSPLCEGSETHFLIEQSSICSLSVAKDSFVLIGKGSNCAHLQGCSFINITQLQKSKIPSPCYSSSSLFSSSTYSSNRSLQKQSSIWKDLKILGNGNTDEGSIIRTESCIFKLNALDHNNALFGKKRLLLATSVNSTFNTRQELSTGNHSFIRCSFCSQSEERGGAIFSSAALTIRVCIFFKCNCTKAIDQHGGAMYISGDEQILMEETNFSDCKANVGGAACLRSRVFFSVLNCRFLSSPSAQGVVQFCDNYKGALYSGCVFAHNSKNYETGVGKIVYNGLNFSFHDCLFEDNHASRMGCIYLSQPSEAASFFNVSFVTCFFSGNEASYTGTHANDIYGIKNWSNLTKQSFVETFSTSIEPHLFIDNGASGHENWIPFPPSPKPMAKLHSSAQRGSDDANCGNETFLCLTLKYTFDSRWRGLGKLPMVVHRGEKAEESIVIGSESVEISGEDKEKTVLYSKVTRDGGGLFEITSGSLELSAMTLVHSRLSSCGLSSLFTITSSGTLSVREAVVKGDRYEESYFEKAACDLKEGRTKMENVVFCDFDVSGASLISVGQACELNLTSVDISGITNMNGDGGAVSGVIDSGKVVIVENASWRGCRSEKGNGGGVNVVVRSGGTLKIGATLGCSIDMCSAGNEGGLKGKGGGVYLRVDDGAAGYVFDGLGFGANNQAWKGNNMFVSGDDLKRIVSKEHFKSCIEANREHDSDAMGSESSDEDFIIPLSIYMIHPFPIPGFVGGRNCKDFNNCGFDGYPCETMNFMSSVQFPSSDCTIILNPNFVLNEVVEMEDCKWNVSCELVGERVEVAKVDSATSEGMIMVKNQTELANIGFYLPANLGAAASFISCSSGTFHMKCCSASLIDVSSEQKVSFSIVRVTGGRMFMESFISETGIEFSSSSMIWVDGECEVVLCECKIVGVKKESGNGGCISAEKKKIRMAIDSCNFSGCGVVGSSSCGGGMMAKMKGENELFINGTTAFDGCAAPSGEGANGRGGGMMIRVEEVPLKFEIGGDVTFGSLEKNDARYGKDAFVWCERGVHLREVTNRSSFEFFDFKTIPTDALQLSGMENGNESCVIPLHVFLCSVGTQLVVDGSCGTDHDYCGFASFPCLTVDYCAGRRAGSNVESVVLESGSSINGEFSFPLFAMSVTSQISPGIMVDVHDNGDVEQEGLVECASNIRFENISFALPLSMKESHCSFLISKKNLKLTECVFAFLGDKEGAFVEFSVIHVCSGDLTMKGVCLEDGIGFHGCSGFTVENGGKITMEDCVLCNVSKMNGNGGCMTLRGKSGENPFVRMRNVTIGGACEAGMSLKGGGLLVVLDAGIELAMEKVGFKNCSVPAEDSESVGRGLGGGMFLELLDGSGVLTLSELTFETCSAWKGRNMFVDAMQLDIVVNNSTMKFEMEGMEREDLMGFEESTTKTEYRIPLEVYFREIGDGGYVGGKEDEGFDHSGCGFGDVPCESVGFLLSHRIKSSQNVTEIHIYPSFAFKECLSFSNKNIILRGLDKSLQTKFVQNITGEGSNVVESFVDIEISDVSFEAPIEFVPIARMNLFFVGQKTMKMLGCSCVWRSDETKSVEYNFARVEGGTLEVVDFEARYVKLGNYGMFVVEGNEARGRFSGMAIDSVSCNGQKGLMVGRLCSMWINDSSVSGSELLQNCALLSIDECAETIVDNTSLSDWKRQIGNGGGIEGKVGKVCSFKMKQCNMTNCGALIGNGKGGGMMISLSGSGRMEFDDNTVKENIVSEQSGQGGGLFINIDSTEVNYWVRRNVFASNVGLIGWDVYVVCPSPRTMITLIVWEGFDEGTGENNFWVGDGEAGSNEGVSLKTYLFPGDEEIVFVDESGKNDANCGMFSVEGFCRDVGYGMGRMNESQWIVQIKTKADLEKEVERREHPLAIRGKNSESVMNVKAEGHLLLSSSLEPNNLMLSSLRIWLPEEKSEFDEFVCVESGKLSITSCAFGEIGEEKRQCWEWIVNGRGGEIGFVSVNVPGMLFKGGCGMVCVGGECYASVENTSVGEVSGEGGGIIVIGQGGEMMINSSNITQSSSQKGGVIQMAKGSKLQVENDCYFVGCLANEGDGGMINSEMNEYSVFTIRSSTLKGCSANTNDGRGGSVFAEMTGNGVLFFGNVSFSENVAWAGRDMFVRSVDLNESMKSTCFEEVLFDEEGRVCVDFAGSDETNFGGAIVDLKLLLVQYESEEIRVSKKGCDVLGCGSETYPCLSFWRGFENVKGSLDSKRVVITDGTFVENEYELTGCEICSEGSSANDSGEKSRLEFKTEIKGERGKTVITGQGALRFAGLVFALPYSFSSGHEILITYSSMSESEALIVRKCLFECSSSRKVDVCLINGIRGKVEMRECAVGTVQFVNTPFVLQCDINISSCIVEGISSECEEGGAMRVILDSVVTRLQMKNITAVRCRCVKEESKGGFLFVDSSKANQETPFVFEEMVFDGNEAWRGKNIFVVERDLNRTVSERVFHFDFESLKDDENAFEGRDVFNEATDLFRFLVSFSSGHIYVGEKGFDVKRCGSERDPCCSFWKGMQQLEVGAEKKAIFIWEKTKITDGFDLSEMVIASASLVSRKAASPHGITNADGYENQMATLEFERSDSSGSGGYVKNRKALLLEMLNLLVKSSLQNEKKAAIINEDGMLNITDCSFSVKEVPEQEGNINMVRMEKGRMVVCRLSCESTSFCESVLLVNGDGVECDLNEIVFTSVSFRSGSVVETFAMEESVKRSHEGCVVSLCNSTFSSITGNGVEPSGMISEGSEGAELVVNGSRFEGCLGNKSMKGGVCLFELSEGGVMRMVDCLMVRCGCSMEGRGGGVYVATRLTEDLDFCFVNMNFSANSAKAGRDIYVECHRISRQINETQFLMDLRESVYVRLNAICGIDRTEHTSEPIDLMSIIAIFQSDSIVLSSALEKNGKNERNCGSLANPCLSIEYGLSHVTRDVEARMLVDEESKLMSEVDLHDLTLTALNAPGKKGVVAVMENAFAPGIEAVVRSEGVVSVLYLVFAVQTSQPPQHSTLFAVESGFFLMSQCGFSGLESDEQLSDFPFICLSFGGGSAQLFDIKFDSLHVISSCLIECQSGCESVLMEKIGMSDVTCERWCIHVDDDGEQVWEQEGERMLEFSGAEMKNITCSSLDGSVIRLKSKHIPLLIRNSTFGSCTNTKNEKGEVLSISSCSNVIIESSVFDGEKKRDKRNTNRLCSSAGDELCKWNGSLVDCVHSHVELNDTTIKNSEVGGLSVSSGNIWVMMSMFSGNDPSVKGYPSARRNIICTDHAMLNIRSLKGGDGAVKNSSLWIVSENCEMEGIVGECTSSFFIPLLESVEKEDEGTASKLKIKGQLLLPCNLMLRLVFRRGSEEQIEKYDFDTDGFVSENEVHSWVSTEKLGNIEDETEVSVSLQYGDPAAPSFSNSFILKNKSETKVNGDENLSEGGKEGKISWVLIVCIVIVVILLIVSIIFIVRWKKVKNEAEDLREIVNDNIRKDPKAFEMVTMEMSPEEQWKRAEREAEKKNDERMKKRVYDTNMQHSESSEHLLSESGSTEYILGRDSDKIPDWALEMVEEEETRKRTPSPSISSASTTDTSDTDSTFVRSEILCPTTSSMSNLVDAMACSSPHEKLIVDLRDSLFMLLHGRNEKKEMEIGTLQQREYTAAQILFWVANLALHSFDEMDNPLSSLANLSPHIVLFSEHMVICIVMHSDFLSDGSDSSSVSSSTVVTSASDDDDESDSLPSSAFEDEDSFKKECLRWMAPELLINKKMGATKESVAFSIGMMLWECLTLKIPFGEYEAEVAGQKIVNGERPNLEAVECASWSELVKCCWAGQPSERKTLGEVKRELIGHFPAGAVMVTMPDAIDLRRENESGSGSGSGRSNDGYRS